MRLIFLLPFGVIFIAAHNAFAGADDIKFSQPAAEIRPVVGTGASVGIYGGATGFQNGDANLTSPSYPGQQINASEKSETGGVAGIHAGYTFKNFSDTWPAWLMPAIDLDFHWAGYRYKSDADSNPSFLQANLNTYSLMVEPKVRFAIGSFRPYVGLGLGGTYLHADSPKANLTVTDPATGKLYSASASSTKSLDDGAFSVEGVAGFEYFLDAHWAVDFDYKYQYIDVQGTIHTTVGGVPLHYNVDGIGTHIFTGGLAYYF
jgi:opacity protein-like surface antigen